MKLILFPGTFNPIHIAHLIIAETALSTFKADKVVFVTSNIPPHRDTDIANSRQRHEMVLLSCQHNNKFEASNVELIRKGPSYTYETLIEIREFYPEATEINMIIGADAVRQLHTWHNNQLIVNMTKFYIASRPDNPYIDECIKETNLKNFNYNIIDSPLMNISSTLIRNNIAKNRSIKYLVTDPVEEYIYQNDLYRK